jgi:hypothetical protein
VAYAENPKSLAKSTTPETPSSATTKFSEAPTASEEASHMLWKHSLQTKCCVQTGYCVQTKECFSSRLAKVHG